MDTRNHFARRSYSDGAVLAAGAVVNKNVEPYEIVGGVPAKHIKYRFDAEKRKILQKIKWWDWSHEKIEKHIELLYDHEQMFGWAKGKIIDGGRNTDEASILWC